MLPEVIEQGLEDGRLRNLRALTAPDFEIEGIASRLAKINRFCGATRFPLSVATHSVVVSYLSPPGLELTGLLHDITESFGIGDMISPVKRINPAFRELEADILDQLCYGDNPPFPCLMQIAMIEHADKRATAIEAYVHRGSFPDWAETMGAAYPLTAYEAELCLYHYRLELTWHGSRDMFLDRYRELTSVK